MGWGMEILKRLSAFREVIQRQFGEFTLIKKKNFYATRQLVTRSVVKLYVSESCSGDSF